MSGRQRQSSGQGNGDSQYRKDRRRGRSAAGGRQYPSSGCGQLCVYEHVGLTPEFLEVLEAGFVEFLSELTPEDSKKEYLLPTIVDGLIREKRAEVTLLETRDTWFGVTYKEDKQTVVDAFAELIRKGIYKEKLFDN